MRTVLASLSLLGLAASGWGVAALAQRGAAYDTPDAGRAALARAQAAAREASGRAERLEVEAREATEAAEKTATEAAALAARIQQAEAGIAAAEARIGLIDDQRSGLRRRLAERREPLVRLTGALQKLARRPVALSVLRPGSLRETVYLRAILESTVPVVRQRTIALRAEIDRGRTLEAEARQAVAALQENEQALGTRRTELAALETRQRLASRAKGGTAAREARRALALAEEARDLDSLVEQLDEAGALRAELAALPGPVLRPARPEDARVAAIQASPTASARADAPSGLQLPVAGRTVSGFGESGEGGVRRAGIGIAPQPGAQVVSPAAGRIAFAGPYRGFGRIVIVEHDGGWTSVITGLAREDARVGDEVVAGGPIGVAARDEPLVEFELRRDGTPVNPLRFLP